MSKHCPEHVETFVTESRDLLNTYMSVCGLLIDMNDLLKKHAAILATLLMQTIGVVDLNSVQTMFLLCDSV